MRFKKLFFLSLVLIMFALPVMAEEQEEVQLAAVVNGMEITVNEVDAYANLQQFVLQLAQTDREFTQLLFTTEAGQELINEYRKLKLDDLILEKLLEEEARKQLTLTQEKKDEIFQQQIDRIKSENNLTDEQLLSALNQQGIESLEQYQEIFFENNESYVYISELQQKLFAELTVDDQAIEDYYTEHKDWYMHEEEVRASHILLETEEEAQEVLAQINDGADFAEMAKEYSIGPTGENGGDLGYFSKGSMVSEFEEAVFSMEVGEVKGPVKTQYGYHLIKLTDKKEAGITPLSEVKEEIRNTLLDEKKQEIWDNLVKELRENADIEIKL